MKLLYISSLYYPQAVGGAEKIAQVTAEAMAARGHRVSLVTLCQRTDARTEWLNGVKVRYVPVRNVYQPFVKPRPRAIRVVWHLLDTFNLVAAQAVGRVIDEEAPDLVHTHNITGFSAAVWPQVRRRHLPCVHTMFDYYLLCAKSSSFRRGHNCPRPCSLCRILTLPRRRAVNAITAALAVSNFVLASHQRQGALQNVPIQQVVMSAIPNAAARRTEVARTGARTRFGYLGRLIEPKGINLLLSDFSSISHQYDTELLIGGTGEDDYVRDLQSRYDNSHIRFVGFVDANSFMEQIDALIVPSLWNDPLPTVIFEAYAHGRPVIGARRGGIPELIDEGKTGLLFAPEVSGSLLSAIERFLTDPSLFARMRLATLAKAQYHSVEKMIDSYLYVYDLAANIGA